MRHFLSAVLCCLATGSGAETVEFAGDLYTVIPSFDADQVDGLTMEVSPGESETRLYALSNCTAY